LTTFNRRRQKSRFRRPNLWDSVSLQPYVWGRWLGSNWKPIAYRKPHYCESIGVDGDESDDVM